MKKLLHYALAAVLMAPALTLFAQDYNIQLRSTMDFPGQTLANICGYTQNGREYALIGGSKGLIIVEVTNPDNPVQIVQIPGPDNLWKEIKTYKQYAYVTSEGGGGVQIVNLSNLPTANLPYHNYEGSGAIAGQLTNIHALHIDVTKGFLYTFGGALNTGVVHDLNADPYNPKYVGRFDQLGYIHDGYADNDTLYGCHIYSGLLSVVDMSDKQNPQLLGSVQTPGSFTHNSWLLDDHRYILTTDEEYPSFVTAYDISDPSDIKEVDRIARDNGMESIGHNTHVRDNWAVTSWYIDGVTIVDAHRPTNLVQVARYDTWSGGGEFDGCWGVFPFFPSGTMVASNIPTLGGGAGKLFVLTPTYVRACYLEGKILNGCSGQPVVGASIKINSNDPLTETTTRADGSFATGQPTPGNFTVTVSKAGFPPQTLNVSLSPGVVTPLNVTLQSGVPTYSINATVLNVQTNQPVANAPFYLVNGATEYKVQTNASGQFDLNCIPEGTYRTGAWGFLASNVNVNSNGAITISLQPGYYDDFELNLGWTTEATSEVGLWVRAEPVGTFNDNNLVNPEEDLANDNGDLCFVTGNGGGQPGNDDVDAGSVTLSSPPMKLAAYSDAVLNYSYWFYNNFINSEPPNDKLEVRVSNGQQTVTILTETVSQSVWRNSGDIHLKDYIALTDNVQVHFIASDTPPGHWVESAVDAFQVTPSTILSTGDLDQSASLLLSPNPTNTDFQVHYNWPEAKNVTLEVRNLLGQVETSVSLNTSSGTTRIGAGLPTGVYLIALRSEGRASAPVKAIKQ